MNGERPDLQQTVLDSERGKVVCCDSAYDVRPHNRGRDVVVNASYCGVLPARFIGRHRPRGAIGVDCAIGPEGAGIAGLWFLEALDVPAAAADVATVELGNGVDLYEHGLVSRFNAIAEGCGVSAGMEVTEAARRILLQDPISRAPEQVDNREVMATGAHGRSVVCIDSIALGRPEDREANVLVAAGHTGRSAVEYLRRVRPWGFVGSDGGGGKDGAGMAGIYVVEADGIGCATVDARSARMGDGHSTYEDGVISARNSVAAGRGVEIGQPAREAAVRLLSDS